MYKYLPSLILFVLLLACSRPICPPGEDLTTWTFEPTGPTNKVTIDPDCPTVATFGLETADPAYVSKGVNPTAGSTYEVSASYSAACEPTSGTVLLGITEGPDLHKVVTQSGSLASQTLEIAWPTDLPSMNLMLAGIASRPCQIRFILTTKVY